MSRDDLPEQKLRRLGEVWFRAAERTAIVAAIFCAVVAALLFHNDRARRERDILRQTEPPAADDRGAHAEFAELMGRLRHRRDDEALRGQIRSLDVELRSEHERRMHRAATGRILLVVGAVVLLASVLFAVAFRRKPAEPGPTPRAHEQRRTTALSRGAVAAAAGVLVAAALTAALPRWTARPPEPSAAPDPAKQWPRFRGPGGRGVSAFTNVPADWDGPTGRNILWKARVPLPGKNSPVLWGDRVFLSGANRNEREVFCFDADSGELLWRRPVRGVPGRRVTPPAVEEMTGYAAPTMATDGRRVYAIFANGDVAAFDLDGRPAWTRNFQTTPNAYGYASSLLTWKNRLILQLDRGATEDEGDASFITALDGATGNVVWETSRPVRDSWGSPILIPVGSAKQIVTCATGWIIAYNPATGEELWRAAYADADIGPSPTFADGLVYAANDQGDFLAVRADGRGDVSKTHVVFRSDEDLPDIVSPLADGTLAFIVTGSTVACYDAKSGERLWGQDFPNAFIASPSLVGVRVYLTDAKGVTYIFRSARSFEKVGESKLGEPCETCPAFADGRLYLRGSTHLFCIGRADGRR